MKKILLAIAFLVMLLDFSSCKMHGVSASPKVWRPAGNTRNHWGRERRENVRHRYWGHHRSGPRPYRNRGHYRY